MGVVEETYYVEDVRGGRRRRSRIGLALGIIMCIVMFFTYVGYRPNHGVMAVSATAATPWPMRC